MLHEHLFTLVVDPPKQLLAVEQPVSFPLMYLAGGVTTLRTTGSIDAQADLAIKRAIDSGQRVGPDMFLTAPYLRGQSVLVPQMHTLGSPEEVRRAVDDGAAQGMTSFKAYTHLTPEELKAGIEEAHSKGLKVTGHLCSVGFTEAIDLGIDGLEHGLVVDTEFFRASSQEFAAGRRCGGPGLRWALGGGEPRSAAAHPSSGGAPRPSHFDARSVRRLDRRGRARLLHGRPRAARALFQERSCIQAPAAGHPAKLVLHHLLRKCNSSATSSRRRAAPSQVPTRPVTQEYSRAMPTSGKSSYW